MSLSTSLNNALSGLTATSRQAEVTSSNLANALTDGFGRRELNLSSQVRVGGGVRIDGVTRQMDKGILSERRLADAQLGGRSTTAQALAKLEGFVGAPGDEASLPARIIAFETALTSAAAQPSSDLRLSQVHDALRDLATSLNTTQDGIQGMREAADRDIAGQVATLNAALARVEQLNGDITRAVVTGAEPAGLMDQRQLAIDEISEIVPLRTLERENGRLALITTSGEVMLDGPAPTYEFTPTTTIMPHMTLGGAMLSGIVKDGAPLDANGFGPLRGGSLEASFDLRDQVLVEAQTGLDAVARDLLERLQDPAVDPSRAPGQPALLTDGGAEFLAANEVGLAGRVSANPAVDPTQGGALRLIRDGIGAAAGPVGSSEQINRLLAGLADPRPLAVGGVTGAASDHAARLSADVGAERVRAEADASFATARWSALKEAELAGGVDSDQELQMLLRVEQAYAANARVIETVQAMIRALMEI